MMIRIVPRSDGEGPNPKGDASPLREHGLRLAGVLAALIASGLIMLLLGYNPLDIYGRLIAGSLGTAYRLRNTFQKAIPLSVLSLGTLIAFRMKFWNIGQEGQFYMGAYGASLAAFSFPDLPPPLLLSLMFISALVFGGLWALIPALLKIRFSVSETLVTLMLNYVAAKWVSYLQYGPWRDPAASGFPKIASFSANAVLPSLWGLHSGWIITVILALVLWFVLRKTRLGYEIDVLGESEATARYAGMYVFRIMITVVLISGGLCGSAGMMQASAVERSLSEQLSGGLGFTAVITTWLSRLSPPAVLLVSFLFSMLIQGGSFLQSSLQIPASISQVLQGIIIFFVLGSDFFLRYRISLRSGAGSGAP
ncbi:MAG: ABC transporter permease [Treponema sp.]|jgi:simple sugar transport system permease protein|nr:ABC transporter permease [Treponema sp.]